MVIQLSRQDRRKCIRQAAGEFLEFLVDTDEPIRARQARQAIEFRLGTNKHLLADTWAFLNIGHFIVDRGNSNYTITPEGRAWLAINMDSD